MWYVCGDEPNLTRAHELAEQEDDPATEDVDMQAKLDDEQDKEVTIVATADGNVVQCGTQVHDYRFRALALNHLSVWDFVSCVDKVTRTSLCDRSTDEVFNDKFAGCDSEDDAENPEDDEALKDINEHANLSMPK